MGIGRGSPLGDEGLFDSVNDDIDQIRVLLVDDDQDFVSLASTLLESESERIEITTYNDPRAALDRTNLHRIDCIVCDYRMPEMDGIDVLEIVREEHPSLPFILFTGKGNEEVAERAISAGATDYIKKDGSAEQYAMSANRIENVVRQYRTQQRWVRNRRLDTLGQSVFETVLNERTKETIEQGVCEKLAGSEFYSFVWIGERNPRTGEIQPRACAGEDELIDAVTFSTERDLSQSVEARALTSEKREIVTESPESGEWFPEVDHPGFEAAVGYPLTYEEISYGVLGVYTDRADAFISEELDLLDLIAEFMAFSVGASNRRRGDISRQVTEIKFDVTNADMPFVRIASTTGGNVRLTQTAFRSDGTRLTSYTVDGASTEQLREIDGLLGLDVVRLSDETGSETRLAIASSDPWWKEITELYGANIRNATADEQSATLLIELPAGSDVRAIVDLLEERYPNVEPVARRERTRSEHSIDELRPLLAERLTDRQREVLKTAYHAGYYEWPHEASSEDVAELLGIAQPTFAEHFWTAQRRIVELLFEVESTEQ